MKEVTDLQRKWELVRAKFEQHEVVVSVSKKAVLPTAYLLLVRTRCRGGEIALSRTGIKSRKDGIRAMILFFRSTVSCQEVATDSVLLSVHIELRSARYMYRGTI